MKFNIGEGRTVLGYEATFYGGDLYVHIDGGVSHIGGVTAASVGFSETVTFPGHKEHFLTRPLAEELASVCRCRVVVTAGVHLDAITKEEIDLIIEQNQAATEKIAALSGKEGNTDEN